MDLYIEDLNRKRQEAQKRMQDIITTAEADVIANASRGEFLVKLQTTHGTRSYRLAVDLHPNELAWWDTTAGMRSREIETWLEAQLARVLALPAATLDRLRLARSLVARIPGAERPPPMIQRGAQEPDQLVAADACGPVASEFAAAARG